MSQSWARKQKRLQRREALKGKAETMTGAQNGSVAETALAIARHEFGHYVTAKVLGFKVGDVSVEITPPRGHEGRSSIEPATSLRTFEQIVSYLENRIMVVYAGAQAESLTDGKLDNEKALRLLGFLPAKRFMENTASQDYAKARELVHLLRSMTYEMSDSGETLNRQLKEISDRVWNKGAEIVEAESTLIVELANALASRFSSARLKVMMSKGEIDEMQVMKDRFSGA